MHPFVQRNLRRIYASAFSLGLLTSFAPIARGQTFLPIDGMAQWPQRFTESARAEAEIRATCKRIGTKLGSVSFEECIAAKLTHSGAFSVTGVPILVRDFPSRAQDPSRVRVLLFGGIHGDELSSVSIVFKWVSLLGSHDSGTFDWRIVPLLNPDGLLRSRSQRTNYRGVDLNRNFPSPDWFDKAHRHWAGRSKSPRLFPGPAPLSEPESRWLALEIDRYRPDFIIAVHAPIKLVDFDGPNEPPGRLGSLRLRRMGTYPGSLGRYAGVHRGLPVVTIELPHAGIMPTNKEQRRIWSDLVAWIERRSNPIAESERNNNPLTASAHSP